MAKYKEHPIAKKANEFIYLEGWYDPVIPGLAFQLGNKMAWFRNHHKGYKFVGKSKTICVYPPPYGKSKVLNHTLACDIAQSYITGNYSRVNINFMDCWY